MYSIYMQNRVWRLRHTRYIIKKKKRQLIKLFVWKKSIFRDLFVWKISFFANLFVWKMSFFGDLFVWIILFRYLCH